MPERDIMVRVPTKWRATALGGLVSGYPLGYMLASKPGRGQGHGFFITFAVIVSKPHAFERRSHLS